ncbi:unnamed protein product [Polarella glacialis]|uniref:Uncharacterized protein n=1 Tax=Polarella glacialis TaxID=89957 RepID=A0A813LZ10_POLGL|nr:unnamed protein product [Polarella glacialis]
MEAGSEVPAELRPLLTLEGALYERDGWLLLAEYLPLRRFFCQLGAQPRAPGQADPDELEAASPEASLSQGSRLKSWRDSRGQGWIANRGARQRWFSLAKWQNLKLARLMAQLQLDMWARHMRAQPQIQRQVQAVQAVQSVQAIQRQERPLRRLRQKADGAASSEASQASGGVMSPAAWSVFGQFDPLFRCWLCPEASEQAVPLNPSPFDVYALLCASRLFAHLGSRLPFAWAGLWEVQEESQQSQEDTGHELLSQSSSSSSRRHLHNSPPSQSQSRPSRCRLTGKQPPSKQEPELESSASPASSSRKRGPEPGSLLHHTVQALKLSVRVAGGISGPVQRGDLDAVRFHLLRHGWAECSAAVPAALPLELKQRLGPKTMSRAEDAASRAEEAVMMAVRFSQVSLVKFLLRSADRRIGWAEAFGTNLFHSALANCVLQRATEGPESREVLRAVLSGRVANLDAPIWPELPALGGCATPVAPEAAATACPRQPFAPRWPLHEHANGSSEKVALRIRSEQSHSRLRSVLGLQLPFLRRGQGPLAWVVHAHSSICSNRSWMQEELGPRLCDLARVLVLHGANQACLSRRQQRSLGELLQGEGVAGAPVRTMQPLGCNPAPVS